MELEFKNKTLLGIVGMYGNIERFNHMGWLIEIINRDNPSALFDGYLQRVRHVVWPIWELGGWPG